MHSERQEVDMVFKREDVLKSMADGLAWLAASCKLRGSLHLFDNNVLSHHFFCQLLNGMYGFKLEVMDRIQSNYPAVDLGDTENRIAYQVTTEKSGAKVQHTLNKFVEQGLQAKFNKLKVLVIGERQARYTALSIPKEIAFAPNKDIIDLTSLVKDAEGLPTLSLEKLALIFDEELSQVKRQSNWKAASLNQVLWLLDNEIESRKFERLCTDLMYRAGYTEIEPYGGTHDRGRDAETRLLKGTASTGGTVFFQYSQEGRWGKKLSKELKKVQQNEHQIVAFVFVSSRSVSGAARDKLKTVVAKQYGWDLIIYEREWLRLQLEEAHPDLAAKYLGIEPTSYQSVSPIQPKPPLGPEDQEKKAWQLYRIEDYDGAAVEFKRWVSKHRNDLSAWNALAWCQFRLYRYQEALVSIANALAIDEENAASLTIKASILTEDGIVRDSRPNLVMARDIFARIANTSNQWVDHYNYANVLSGIGEYNAARDEFLKAISFDPNQAMVWKNLACAWAYLGNHKEEAKCLDTALRLNPHHPEALVGAGRCQRSHRRAVPERQTDRLRSPGAEQLPRHQSVPHRHAGSEQGLHHPRHCAVRERLAAGCH
jgi:tetratricopeptide (TPR) repeat protein